MSPEDRRVPSHLRRAAALVLASGAASAAFAGTGLQWRLSAQVPLVCAILAVDTPPDRPASLAVTSTCNAERYQLVLRQAEGQVDLRAAHSSAGPLQINGSAVTITSSRPGEALTVIELTAPVSLGQLAVNLQPL